MGIVSLMPREINHSQLNMRRIIDCNWSITYGVRITTPIVDNPSHA